MNEQPFSTASRQACGTLAVDEAVVDKIAKIVDKQKKETRQTVYKMHVKPHLVSRGQSYHNFPNVRSSNVRIDVHV